MEPVVFLEGLVLGICFGFWIIFLCLIQDRSEHCLK